MNPKDKQTQKGTEAFNSRKEKKLGPLEKGTM